MRFPVLGACLALAACATPDEDVAQIGEQAAVAEVEAQFPDTDVGAAANCVRDNATSDELTVLAAGGDAGTEMTRLILGRAGTQACLADNNVSLPGQTG